MIPVTGGQCALGGEHRSTVCGMTHARLDRVAEVVNMVGTVEPSMRLRHPMDEATIVLSSPLRQRLLRYVAAVEDRRGYR